MAQAVFLELKSNGTAIDGESTVESMGRADMIECILYKDGVTTARDGQGQATGLRQYDPIIIEKRIDKSTPLLAKALRANEVIEAKFRFYRPNPAGDGTTEQYFTIEILEGRVSSIHRTVENTLNPSSSEFPPFERIAFVFHTFTNIYETTGAMDTDNWREQA